MALNVPDGDCIAAFEHTLTGWSRPLICTLGIGVDVVEPMTVARASALFDAWKNNLSIPASNTLTFVKVTCYVKDPLGYIPIVSTSASITGTGSGSALTPNTAVMIQKNTARPGRSGRGRMFFPGFPEAGVDPNGNIVGANLAIMNGALADLYDDITALSFVDDIVLFHDEDNVSPAPTIVDSLTANARVSSIAKRFRR